jgi:hypothetical protein
MTECTSHTFKDGICQNDNCSFRSSEDDFRFDDKKHAYFLNGKPMLGCTSVLGVIAKPALVPWAARMAVDYLVQVGKPYYGPNDDLVDHYIVNGEQLDAAKTAHRRKKEDAAEKGTDLHELVEKWVGVCIAGNAGQPLPKGNNWVGEEEYAPIAPFIEWARKEQIRFIATEQRLYSKALWVAGTCDLIFEKNGKRYIGDIKTYKKIWDRVPLIQCAGYSIMYEEMNALHDKFPSGDTLHSVDPAHEIDGYCVICLPKERAFNEAEDVLWSFDPEAEKQAFISAVKLYKYLNQN